MSLNDLRAIKFLFEIYQSPLPFKLNFAITYKCNFKCKTCKIWKIYYKKPELEKEELNLNEIDTFLKKSKFLKWISFTGGEPFLRHDLYEIVKSAYENCKHLFIVNIPTNGFYTEEIVKTSEKILDKTSIPVFLVAISCDGTQKIHEAIKNKKTSWEKAIQTFRNLIKIRENYPNFHVILEYTLSKLNEKFFLEDIKKLRKLKIEPNKIHLNIFHTSSSFYHNASTNLFVRNSIIRKIDFFRKIRRGVNFLSIFSNIYLKILTKYLSSQRYPFNHCFAGEGSVFLDPYGNLYPCTIFNERIGNIREFNYDLAEIVKSKKMGEVKKLIQTGECPHCFTPCEVYQNMILNLKQTIKDILVMV